MARFLLDSDVFLQAYKLHYPLDVAETFWQQISEMAAEGEIGSIDRVKAELYTNPDSLTEWCDDHLPDNFFVSSADCIVEYASIMTWGQSRNDHYTPSALAEFARAENADPWLVAYAMKHDRILVTHERPNPASKRRVPLPEVCTAKRIDFMNTMALFRELGRKF